MRKHGYLLAPAVSIVVLLAAAGIASALTVSDATIRPAVATPGDMLTITAKVDDPEHQVATVNAVSVEFTRMYDIHRRWALNDLGEAGDQRAGDGIWSRRFYIPASPAGPHHFQIVLLDAAGEPLTATGPGAGMSAPRSIIIGPVTIPAPGQPIAATVVLDVRNEGGFASPQLLAAAAPWRPEALIRRLQANPRQPDEPFTFVVTGDSCYHPEVFKYFLAIMVGLEPDFSMDCGDIVNGENDPGEWPFFFAVQMRHVTWPFFLIMGNHDTWPWQAPPGTASPQGKLFEQLFGASDYYFDYGGFRFVAVETARSAISPERLKWLERVLDTPLRKIVFTHMPPVSMRPGGQRGSFEIGAQEFADLLAAKKVERVYVGHLHNMGVREYKGVTYVISGASGQGEDDPTLTRSYRHLVFVEAGPGPLRETIYKRDGSHFVLDTQKWIAGERQ